MEKVSEVMTIVENNNFKDKHGKIVHLLNIDFYNVYLKYY